MSDVIYPEGVRTFKKHEKAPEFVLGTVIITPNELVKWLKENPQYLTDYKGEKQIKLQCLKKRDGGITFQVDNYRAADPVQKIQESEPVQKLTDAFDLSNDLPF